MRYTNCQLHREMRKIHQELGRTPTVKEWDHLSKINSSTITRRFGGWSASWKKLGFVAEQENINNKKRQIIIDFIRAFNNNPQIHNNRELLKASGHRLGVIYKYFGTMEGFLNIAKINAELRVSKQDLINEYIKVANKIGRIPTKKDINNNSKYSYFLYKKNFDDLGSLKLQFITKYNTDAKVSEQDLLCEIIRIKDLLGHTPNVSDINNFGKFSVSSYTRKFGGLSNAISKINMSPSHSQRKSLSCPLCGITTKSLPNHLKKHHPEEFEEQTNKIISMFNSGLSCDEIAQSDDIVYNGKSSIVRIINSKLSKAEIAAARKQKIKTKLSKKYSSGQLNWVIDINRNKNAKPEIGKKISESLKESYASGARVAWNRGKNKENCDIIAASAKKTSATLKELYKTGQINRDATGSVQRYRLGAGFTANDRRKIKERAKYKCQFCSVTQEELEAANQVLECDHILPISKGGTDDWKNNGQALCPKCHLAKTTGAGTNYKYDEVITTKINCKINEILKYNGQPLTKKYVSSLGYAERHTLALYLLDFFTHYDFSNYSYDNNLIERDIRSLLRHQCNTGNKTINNQSSVGLKCVKNYFNNILKVKDYRRLSVYEAITDKEVLLKVIMNRLGGMLNDNFEEFFNITPAAIIRGAKLSELATRGSVFKPTAAKAIYKHWVQDGDVAYDFSAGFGGRLLGFYATGINAKYIGVDVEPATYEGLSRMAKDYNINAEIYNCGSENFIPGESVNFAFSSPPYFDHEIYSDHPAQSSNKFSNYNDWLEFYWSTTVNNIARALVSDGVLAVNAGNNANSEMSILHEDMMNVVRNSGFHEIDRWHLRSVSKGGKQKLEPIVFFKKK